MNVIDKTTRQSRILDLSMSISADACNIAGGRRYHVDKNRTEGTKHEVKGAVKEFAGKVTGNKSKEVAGNLEKNAGKLQKEVGKASDEVRREVKKDNRR
jgi:uncharacterized protein YjbJ (UPF0337 family)